MSDLAKAPQWFSIKEAAEYLDVGEPTIYRWIRDGKITFRKVGDSTRFWKEDLDAVMEVHPSDKEVDIVRRVCPACHHAVMVEGVVQSTGLNYFRPKKSRFWTLQDANVGTEAMMCERCGLISWFGDIAKLQSLQVKDDAKKEAKSGDSQMEPPAKEN